MTLLSLLKDRFEQAEKFTKKNFIEDIERSIEDYEAKDSLMKTANLPGLGDLNKRYEFVIPLIFTNVEAMKASLWDRLPDLIFKGRGTNDDDKKRKVEAAYQYLKDKLDLESFAISASHWFILGGFTSAYAGFKSETYEMPLLDDLGQPMMDADGQPMMQTLYSYNDPVLELSDPQKEYFSAESEFSIDSKNVPFQFRTKLMSVDEIKRIYDKEVDADTEVSIDKYNPKGDDKGDIKRAKVRFYYGSLPDKDEVKKDLKGLKVEWQSDGEYYIIYTLKEILYAEKRDERWCRLAKWYGTPNSFFGFGLGKIGRQFQKEKSIRRGQQIRLADVAAFPKYGVKNDGANLIDLNALKDPREQQVVLYESDPPILLQPGNLAEVVTASEQAADRDAQQAFGLMDIAAGAQQSSTVSTATGQTIFAEAADKRVRLAKKNFMKFYKEVVVMLLKLAQLYWDDTKLVTITDEDGKDHQEPITRQDLKDVDFDKDVEIDAEDATVNKDLMRDQYISFYDKTKDDSLVNRKNVIQDVARYALRSNNPERYLKQSDVPPGTVLTDPSGVQYTVSPSGDLVSAQAQNQLATPSGDPTASDPSALAGSAMR